MSNVVSLNKARKIAERAKKRKLADRNAVVHGQSKAERQRADKTIRKQARDLDGQKME